MHFLELEWFLVQRRLLADAVELPRRDVRIVRVVAHRLAVGRLALFAEVAAARLAAVQGVECQQLRELEVVGDPAGVLEALVQIVGRAGHPGGVPKLSSPLWKYRQRPPQ